jgi:hypothetical protein
LPKDASPLRRATGSDPNQCSVLLKIRFGGSKRPSPSGWVPENNLAGLVRCVFETFPGPPGPARPQKRGFVRCVFEGTPGAGRTFRYPEYGFENHLTMDWVAASTPSYLSPRDFSRGTIYGPVPFPHVGYARNLATKVLRRRRSVGPCKKDGFLGFLTRVRGGSGGPREASQSHLSGFRGLSWASRRPPGPKTNQSKKLKNITKK